MKEKNKMRNKKEQKAGVCDGDCGLFVFAKHRILISPETQEGMTDILLRK